MTMWHANDKDVSAEFPLTDICVQCGHDFPVLERGARMTKGKVGAVIYKRGDHVKVELGHEGSGESEWIWVKVDHADEERRLVFGRLDSQPVVNTSLRVGQELAVSYDKIRNHRRFANS